MQSATRTCTQSLGVAGVSIFSAAMDRTFLANPNVADRKIRSTCVYYLQSREELLRCFSSSLFVVFNSLNLHYFKLCLEIP